MRLIVVESQSSIADVTDDAILVRWISPISVTRYLTPRHYIIFIFYLERGGISYKWSRDVFFLIRKSFHFPSYYFRNRFRTGNLPHSNTTFDHSRIEVSIRVIPSYASDKVQSFIITERSVNDQSVFDEMQFVNSMWVMLAHLKRNRADARSLTRLAERWTVVHIDCTRCRSVCY